jgi:hypothetical protein
MKGHSDNMYEFPRFVHFLVTLKLVTCHTGFASSIVTYYLPLSQRDDVKQYKIDKLKLGAIKIRRNSVITNSSGPDIFVRYNRGSL